MSNKNQIKELFLNYCSENNLNIKLSYDMPQGYEKAFGTFDVCKNTLFININYIDSEPKYKIFFYLYHELRHAEQYIHIENFSRKIKESINYVVLYDGTCYKLIDNMWKCCKIDDKDIDFVSIYLNLPYEIDANAFAYNKIVKIFGYSDEIENFYKKQLPKTIIPLKQLKIIFNKIDALV